MDKPVTLSFSAPEIQSDVITAGRMYRDATKRWRLENIILMNRVAMRSMNDGSFENAIPFRHVTTTRSLFSDAEEFIELRYAQVIYREGVFSHRETFLLRRHEDRHVLQVQQGDATWSESYHDLPPDIIPVFRWGISEVMWMYRRMKAEGVERKAFSFFHILPSREAGCKHFRLVMIVEKEGDSGAKLHVTSFHETPLEIQRSYVIYELDREDRVVGLDAMMTVPVRFATLESVPELIATFDTSSLDDLVLETASTSSPNPTLGAIAIDIWDHEVLIHTNANFERGKPSLFFFDNIQLHYGREPLLLCKEDFHATLAKKDTLSITCDALVGFTSKIGRGTKCFQYLELKSWVLALREEMLVEGISSTTFVTMEEQAYMLLDVFSDLPKAPTLFLVQPFWHMDDRDERFIYYRDLYPAFPTDSVEYLLANYPGNVVIFDTPARIQQHRFEAPHVTYEAVESLFASEIPKLLSPQLYDALVNMFRAST